MKITAKLAHIITQKGLHLSVAESFTGGAISAEITAISGASKYFAEGIVCYSNNAKFERLSVNPDTVSTYGAVSRETAMEMLQGLKTHYGIVTTGNAGPLSEKTDDVGHCFIGIKNGDKLEIIERHFVGNRKKVISLSKKTALKELYNSILNN